MGSAETVMSAWQWNGVSGECSKRGLRARHAPPCLRASAQSPCNPCGTGGRLGGRTGVSITRFRCPWAVAAPERMTTWSMSLFLTSAKSHEYCRTASAVPWNHSVPPVPGVCDAASTWIGGGGCQPQSCTEPPATPGRPHLHEAIAAEADARPKVVCAGHVAVQRRGVELRGQDIGGQFSIWGETASPARAAQAGDRAVGHLCQHIHLADAAVDAVAHGHVDEAVGAPNGHCWLGALLGQRVQPRAGPAAQDDGRHALRADLLALHTAAGVGRQPLAGEHTRRPQQPAQAA